MPASDSTELIVVSPFPPSHLGLSEYTLHLVVHWLQLDENLQITVLADRLKKDQAESFTHPRLRVIRCWRYNSSLTSARLLWHIVRRRQAKIVWFDLLYTTFGDEAFSAVFGLTLPFLCRFLGKKSVVTLHHLHDLMELSLTQASRRARCLRPFIEWGLNISQGLILRASCVVVLLKRYENFLIEKTHRSNIYTIPHGFFNAGNAMAKGETESLIIFGKFGSYKKVEVALGIFRQLLADFPSLRLVIVGRNHPSFENSIESALSDIPDIRHRIEFTGYLAEADFPAVFLRCDILLLPYLSTTGVSGVAHIGAAFGLPIVGPRLPDLQSMNEEYGLEIDFFTPGHELEAVQQVATRLKDLEGRKRIAKIHYQAAKNMSGDIVAREYLKLFRKQQS